MICEGNLPFLEERAGGMKDGDNTLSLAVLLAGVVITTSTEGWLLITDDAPGKPR